VAIYIEPVPPLQWWRADTTSPTPCGPVPSVGHENCRHRAYRLTCRQYDRLLSRAAGRCEVCGLPDRENRKGKLYIDHVNDLGNWAVRGLLCLGCNAGLHLKPMFKQYIGASFYLTLLAEAGVTSLKKPEPPFGSVVVDHASRPWRHEDGGWWPRHRRNLPARAESWGRLLYLNGPHNLRTVAGVDPISNRKELTDVNH
jgi:hypothetical protein